MNKYLNPVTEKEFAEIKERFFRGETIQEIHNATSRSDMTLRRIMRCDTYPIFVEFNKSENRRYGESAKKLREARQALGGTPVAKEKTERDLGRWGNLKAFREKLDGVMIDFLVGEFEEKHKELIEENQKLKKEVAELSKLLDEATQPNFVKSLSEKITQVTKEE